MTFLKMTILNVKSIIVRFGLFQTEDKLCEYAIIYMEIFFFHINSSTYIICIGTNFEYLTYFLGLSKRNILYKMPCS